MYPTHEMRLLRADETGAEEWACPTCGRRILLRWPPDYDKRVLEPGDEEACHIGSAEDAPPMPGTAETATAETATAAGSALGHRRLRETGIEPAPTHLTPP